MKNNFAFKKYFPGLLGAFFYSSIFPLPLYPSFDSRTLDCKERYSYEIFGKELINKNDFKKYPTEFLENFKRNLKTFNVSYDLNKGVGTIDGSPAMLMAGNLEANDLIKSFDNLDEDPITNNSKFTETIQSKNSLVPITFFSSVKELRNQAEMENDLLSEKNSIFEEKKFFTIENAYQFSSEFTFIQIFKKDNNIVNVNSNDIETETLDSEKIIKVSTGKCTILN